MNEPLTRGYLIERIFGFIDQYYDPQTAEKILASASPDTLALRSVLEQAEWYPRGHTVELLRAIASAKSDSRPVFDDLVECGRFMSDQATNTFYKMLMKILNPSLFAKKVPSFWERDNKDSGRIDPSETKVADRYIRLKMIEMEGFDHAAPVSGGFCSFVLTAMGKTNVQVDQRGWSLESPGPDSFEIELTWA